MYLADDSPGLRILRALLATFRLGRWFGVEVHVYWAALVLPVLFARWSGAAGIGQGLLLGTLQFVLLFVVIWTHEMGHILVGHRYRIRTDRITLGPLGGLAHMHSAPPNARAELAIALGGPVVHLAWLLAVWPATWFLPDGEDWYTMPLWHGLWYLKVVNLSLLLFNLLPVFPLDGGRAFRALLAMRLHPNHATLHATTVGMVGAVLLAIAAVAWPDRSTAGFEGSIGLVIAVSCFLSCRHERRVAQHAFVYAPGGLRMPWEGDPEAWRHGPAGMAPGLARRPSFWRRWREARAAAKHERAAAADAALDREVDAVLERVHQVGMAGLSAAEKAVLQRASARRRGAG